jgi:hypothetical protein
MADKEVAIKINVDADGGAKSLSELKKEFKETQQILSGLTAGSKEYVKTLERLGGIKDDIGDLNSEIKAFNPEGKIQAVSNVVGGLASGFQAAQGAAALFGAEGEELQKTLLKVQAASAFADGIKGVMGMGDAFKELGLVIKANPITAFLTALLAIGAAAYTLYNQLNGVSSATATLTKELEKQKKSTELLNRSSQRQIELLTAQGGSEREIIAVKEKLIAAQIVEIQTSIRLHKSKVEDVKTNNSLWETTMNITAAIDRKLGKNLEADALEKQIQINKAERSKEDLDAIAKEKEDLLDLQKNLKLLSIEKVNISKAEAKTQKEIDDKELEESRARAAQSRKDLEGLSALKKYLADEEEKQRLLREAKADADAEAETQKILSRLASRKELIEFQNAQTYAGQLENLQIQMDAELKLVEDDEAAKFLIKQKYAEKERQLRLGQAAASLEIAQQSNNAMQGLADLYFSIKMANVKKGSAEEEKAARQQFKVNKGLALTGAILSTAMAAIKSLSQAPLAIGPVPSPIGIASLAATVLTGAASIAKIAATQYTSTSTGGGGGGAMASLGSASGGVSLEPPSSGSTQLNADGTIKSAMGNSQPTIKAVVVETDITTSQKRVNTIEERASL